VIRHKKSGGVVCGAKGTEQQSATISFFNPSHYKLSVEHAPANTYSGGTSRAGTKREWVSRTPMNFWLVVVMLCLQIVWQSRRGS
jgi:hypothetical protein